MVDALAWDVHVPELEGDSEARARRERADRVRRVRAVDEELVLPRVRRVHLAVGEVVQLSSEEKFAGSERSRRAVTADCSSVCQPRERAAPACCAPLE